jgi:hypothetical protein
MPVECGSFIPPDRSIGINQSDLNIPQVAELTPLEKVANTNKAIIDFGQNAPLDSIDSKAFEDSINLRWAGAFPDKSNIPGVKASSKKGHYELARDIGNMIDQMSENTVYKSAYERVDNLTTDFIQQVRNQYDHLSDGANYDLYRQSAQYLMRKKNRIKKDKTQQPPAPPQK